MQLCLFALLTLAASAPSLLAQTLPPANVIADHEVSTTTTMVTEYGWSIDIDRFWMVVGAPSDAATANQGAVYVYQRASGGSWTLTATLFDAAGASQDRFGASVSLDGNRLVVGAPGYDVPATSTTPIILDVGRAYVYDYDVPTQTWVLTQELEPASAMNGAAFGSSVSADGNRIAVGSPGETHSTIMLTKGAAYVWVFNTGTSPWIVEQRIENPVASSLYAGEGFGSCVAIDDDLLVVTAPSYAGPFAFGTVTGLALAFARPLFSWDPVANLGSAYSFQFFPVNGAAISNGHILVAAQGPSFQGPGTSYSVNHFDLSGGWVTPVVLSNTTVATSTIYPTTLTVDPMCVDIDGTRAVVGNGGGATTFEYEGSSVWTEQAYYDAPGSDRWVYSVAVDGEADYPRHQSGGAANYLDFAIDGARVAIGMIDVQGSLAGLRGHAAVFDGPLHRDVDSVSLSAGGVQTLAVRSNSDYAGAFYFRLGSATGIHPGTLDTATGLVLPLAFDAYTLFLLSNLPVPLQTLDANGADDATITINPGTNPSLAGLTYYHAMVVVDPTTLVAVLMTNPVALTFLP
jgi:hypothetical protein